MVVFRKNKKRIFVASFLTIVSLCFLGAGFLLDNRFPNTDLSIEEINAHGDPMANTRQVFQSGGAARSVPFRILFYGQSITEGAWPSQVVDIWRARYPHLAIVSENRAIGGFASPRLRRTIEADVADLSPDLVVFHVYGSHPEYEETIEILNRMTSADVILQTDHATAWPAPRCEMGVTFFPSKSPGCTGFPFRQQIGWSEYMSYHFVPTVALRYGFAVEPRLQRWTEQLQRRGLEPSDMLKDMVHLNEDGERMMAELFDAFVEKLVHERKTPSKGRRIRMNVPAPETDGSITLTVT